MAQAKGRARTLGFFLDLAARLSGDRRFRSAAAALRPASLRASTNFFTSHQGSLARALADQNTPPVARSWGYRMNMGMDAFESMFAKAKATKLLALRAALEEGERSGRSDYSLVRVTTYLGMPGSVVARS
jgi:hypothetical protein